MSVKAELLTVLLLTLLLGLFAPVLTMRTWIQRDTMRYEVGKAAYETIITVGTYENTEKYHH